ncbi:MAG: lysozyme inhibitor LprI family protein [Alphaproteobacteria bacterium]
MKEPRSASVPALVAALAAFGLVGGPAWANEPGPSFDCKKAATPVEKTICDDAFTGFRDGALGKLYSGLVKALSGKARKSLRQEQFLWLKARNRVCGRVADNARPNCLSKRYDKRLLRLGRRMSRRKLGPRARGLHSAAGSYNKSIHNFSGSITVVEVANGPAWVEISTVNGPTAHLCNLWTRQARREGATLTWRDTDEPKCKVTLTFKGRTVRTKASRACRAYCGARGYFEDMTYTKTGR